METFIIKRIKIMVKLISVIGARPQFIKHFSIENKLNKEFNHINVHTGQHFDPEMNDLIFKDLEMKKPEYILKQTKLYGSISEQLAYIIKELHLIFKNENPSGIIVYGDTTSTIAGSLCASYLNIPIFHIEAGLRSNNMFMPEEKNRIITDRLSSLLFCPNLGSKKNLLNEGIESRKIKVVGDIMVDSIKLVKSKIDSEIIYKNKFIFATIHRPYNTDNKKRLLEIFKSLNNIKYKVVLPLHPRTKGKLINFNIDIKKFNNILIINPCSYTDSIKHIIQSELLITDSGGMQKEAYILKKKCVTLRSETEWKETLNGGWNKLIFNNLEIDLKKLIEIEPNEKKHNKRVYGNKVSDKIIHEIKQYFLEK